MSEIVTLGIDGMTCAACVSRVERALLRVPGVQAAVVSLATERAEIQLATADAELRTQLGVAIEKAGYTVHPVQTPMDGVAVDGAAAGETTDVWRVVAALVLAAPLVGEMLGHFGLAMVHLPPLLALALATPVQFILGAPFYRAAWKAARSGSGTMDLLVVLGTTTAYAASAIAVLRDPFGNVVHYFEAAAVVIALVLLGRLLEQRARRSAVRAIHALVALAPERAIVRRGDIETEVAARDVVVGDIVIVKPGARFPVDGVVLEGESQADETLITGESRPVDKRPGDTVIGGALNGDGSLRIDAQAIGARSTLARIVRLVERAQGSKAPVQRLVDRVAAVFVPVVSAIAVGAFLVWWLWLGDATGGMIALVSVLVIACPCALGLATPMAIVAGCAAAARHAILIKDAAALERLALVDTVVFDKTGTLTQGKPAVLRVVPVDGATERQVIALATAVERGSAHPLARALLAHAEALDLPEAVPVLVEALPGRGVKARIDGALVIVGTAALMRETGVAIDALAPAIESLDADGLTRAFVARDGALVGVIGLGDRLRDDATQALVRLRGQKIRIVMATGDARATAERIAAGLAIDEIVADASPAEKLAVVERLRAAGHVVAVVGDGINDAPALAAADIGIAIGGGADAALETAGVAILRGDIAQVSEAIALSRATRARIRENLFWASLFNLLGLPAAAAGLLNPMLAGAAMAFSSLAVALNSLRLMRWRPPLGL